MRDIALDEIVLRKYEIPYGKESKENERELVKKFCLSLGLLQEGDSRDVVVDLLLLFLKKRKERKMLKSDEIVKELKAMTSKGVSEPNIRRQIKRLKDMMIIEKVGEGYRISEFDSLSTILEKKIIAIKLAAIVDRIKEYAKLLDQI
jgi:hypothetical protein